MLKINLSKIKFKNPGNKQSHILYISEKINLYFYLSKSVLLRWSAKIQDIILDFEKLESKRKNLTRLVKEFLHSRNLKFYENFYCVSV